MMLGAYLAYSLIGALGGGAGYWVAVLLAALLVAALGALIESLLLRHLYGAPELLQLLATFGVVLIVKDVVLAAWGPEDLLGPRAAGPARRHRHRRRRASHLRPVPDLGRTRASCSRCGG